MKTGRPRIKMLKSGIPTMSSKTVKTPEKVADEFYLSPEWKALMAEIFRERGRRCEDPACKTPHGPWGVLYGDHIREIKDGGAKLDKKNVLVRCAPCHGQKTARERGKRAGETYESHD